jgi:hypothetical protein
MSARWIGRVCGGVVIAAAMSLLVGCNVLGWGAQVFDGDAEGMVNVTAEYRGLDNQTVAVLVDADPGTLFQFPTAQLEVCAAVSQQIAGNVPGAKTIDPRQVADFQLRNIYWNTTTYSDLAQRLKVTRLVLIDLTEYRVHEPGNVNMYRGVMAANVGVAETNGTHPNDLAYRTHVQVAFPPNSPQGVPDANPRTIRKGTLDMFGLAIGGKFFPHKEPKR